MAKKDLFPMPDGEQQQQQHVRTADDGRAVGTRGRGDPEDTLQRTEDQRKRMERTEREALESMD